MQSKIEFKHTSFLILIKDEEFFSKKLVNHINSQNVTAEFIIADGSKKKQKNIFNKLIPKKKYYYFGEDKDLKTFLQKKLKGINKCTKKFIFFCDQDHLINFKALKNDEEFLLRNKDYSAVGGRVYFFIYIKDKIKIIKQLFGVYYFDFKSFFFKYCFNINFRSHHYLQRKKNVKKIWSLIVKHKFEDIRSAMFVEDLLTLILGKVKYHYSTTVITWAGIKKRDVKKNSIHFVNTAHKNRYEWFKYFFSEQKILIKKILNDNKIFFNNFYVFKFYFFIFDILMNRIIRHNYISILKKIFKKNFMNTQNESSIKMYKELNLKQIIDEDKILK